MLLKEARFQDADAELKKWEVEQRNDLGVASLRARWLHAKGQLNKIEPLLEPLAEKAVERLPKDSTQQGRLMLEMEDSIPPSTSTKSPSDGIAGCWRCSRNLSRRWPSRWHGRGG